MNVLDLATAALRAAGKDAGWHGATVPRDPPSRNIPRDIHARLWFSRASHVAKHRHHTIGVDVMCDGTINAQSVRQLADGSELLTSNRIDVVAGWLRSCPP